MASRMLSVPPDVTVPQTWAAPALASMLSAPNIPAVMETISASYLMLLGQRSAWSGLLWELSA